MKVIAYFDGGCLHKVRAAGAAVVFDEEGNELGRRAHYMYGEWTTTNISEYCGLLLALELSHELGADEVRVLGDSELIIRHFNGVYQCRKEHLKPWLAQVIVASKMFRVCTVAELPKSGKNHKRRNGNSVADALATACMRAAEDLP